MSFLQTFGRILFIVILVVRGIQHIQKPDDWTSKFNLKYREYYDTTSQIPLVRDNVPAELLKAIHPTALSALVGQHGQYIGYTELLTAVSIFLGVPLLPIFTATLLLIESLVFFNPFGKGAGNELYYFIVHVAFVGIAFMMSFSSPRVKKKVVEVKNKMAEKAQAAVSGNKNARANKRN